WSRRDKLRGVGDSSPRGAYCELNRINKLPSAQHPYRFFAQSEREERLQQRIAIEDGGAGARARHEGAARAARLTSFCLAAEPPPGRGDFSVSNFHPGAIPGNLA